MYHGLWRCLLYRGEFRDFSYFQPPLCQQSSYSSLCGKYHDPHALCVYPDPDPDPQKRYELIQLIQLPVAFIFGYLTDFAVWALDKVTYHTYWQQWMLCIVGILLVAVGVSFEVTANVVTLAGEGLSLPYAKYAL